MSQTVILAGPRQRKFAMELIMRAPERAVVKISAEKRSTDQNAKMWAMLSDVSRAKPKGRVLTAEVWKAVFMNALGHEIAMEEGLYGERFPIGFRSSHLTKSQMADLITLIQAWGDQHGVVWTDPQERAA